MNSSVGLGQQPRESLSYARFDGDEDSRELLDEAVTENVVLQPYSAISNYGMIALTISLAGLQTAYCFQYADGTDFLLDIGISPAVIASVWVIPPACGVVIQPLFGVLSDILKGRGGRREPLVIAGGAGLIFSLLSLAWISRLVNAFDEACGTSWITCRPKQVISVLAIVLLNVSAQAVQVGTRARMIDDCPRTQQLDINTWASRVIGLANVLSYILSYGLSSKGTTEARTQELALIYSMIIAGTISIAVLASSQPPNSYSVIRPSQIWNRPGFVHYVRQLKGIFTARIVKILALQFLSWFAWFPYQFYISRYITEKDTSSQAQNQEHTRRLGPLALFLQSMVHLATSLFLPYIVQTVSGAMRNTASAPSTFDIPRFSPIHLWRASQVLYSVSIIGILATKSTVCTLALAAMTGFCWAVTQVIPYTMLTEELKSVQDGSQKGSSEAGLFLGINNISMAFPQIIAGLVCSAIFSAFSEEHPDSLFDGTAGSLATGSLVSLIAVAISMCI
ncbi:hypothetical protein M426DRAFT_326316 [Hypoxylon sp. CI-4A]|nr:hypothetical protein M426DRAFT_326316 [Hypoxylon sp. CI-4A]